MTERGAIAGGAYLVNGVMVDHGVGIGVEASDLGLQEGDHAPVSDRDGGRGVSHYKPGAQREGGKGWRGPQCRCRGPAFLVRLERAFAVAPLPLLPKPNLTGLHFVALTLLIPLCVCAHSSDSEGGNNNANGGRWEERVLFTESK